MKTKINILGKIILFLFFLLIFGFPQFSRADLNSSNAYSAMTAGLRYTYYEVIWCSPHYTKLTTSFPGGTNCQKGTFYKEGDIGVMTYKGEHFKEKGVDLNITFPSTTRTSGTNLIDFFSGIPGGIKFIGEGTYTMRIILVDYAYNASKFEFTYKIDKTAPQFQLTGITENTINTYTPSPSAKILSLSGGVTKYDSRTDISGPPTYNDDKYTNPNPMELLQGQYFGDDPLLRTSHTRVGLYPIYFRKSGDPFNLTVAYSDSYNGSMASTGGGESLVAGADKFDLVSDTGAVLQTNLSLTDSVPLLTSYLTNNLENTQKMYKLRIYDKTTSRNGQKANYSEIIFYAVRDNTPPNMGGNGLAGTDVQKAIELLLKFSPNDTTVWDINISGDHTTTSNSVVSKFISATDSLMLYSSLADKGITGNGINTYGTTTTSDKYEWYNAGIVPNSKIRIENYNSGIGDVITFDTSNRFVQNKNRDKDFRNVDNNRVNGYRKYVTAFNTDGIAGNDKICDLVGNCLNPALSFRVVAKPLANSQSDISLERPTGGKAIANGTDFYTVTTHFRDEYDNSIVGVIAQENGGVTIKTVDTYFDFSNGLYNNQQSDSPTGTKLVEIEDLHTDDNEPVSLGDINGDGKIYFKEKPDSPSLPSPQKRGVYSFTIKSKVPTAGVYPYLSDSTRLKLTQIRPKAISLNTGGIGFYPSADVALGIFDKQTTTDILLNGTNNFLTADTNFLNGTDTTDLNNSVVGTYGNITLNSATNVKYSTLGGRKMEFDFAPPYMYSGSGFTLAKLIASAYADDTHTKVFYKLDSSLTSNVTLFEQYLPSYGNGKKYTPGYFDVFKKNGGSQTNINTGNTLVATNANLSSGSYSFPINVLVRPHVTSYSGAYSMGYASYISYNVGSETIVIPSISRNLSNDISGGNDNEQSSRFYFPFDSSTFQGTGDDYVILGDSVLNTGLASSLGVGITGLTTKNDKMISGDTGGKANVNIGSDLTRMNIWATFKQNVIKNSAGFGSTSGKQWCEVSEINNNDLNLSSGNDLDDCTVTVNGEKISFIKGNVTINCSGNCILGDIGKRTLVVMNGYTYIKSNISTYNKNSQLLIGTMTDAGLSNITITDVNSFDINSTTYKPKVKGWTFIDPQVTNIDAFIVSQGPMVSYDGTKLYGKDISDTDLKNQLHIYGSVISLNTIGGAKLTGSVCPYIIEGTCDQKIATVFDLVSLRRYALIGANMYGGDAGYFVSQHPSNLCNGTTCSVVGATRSGGNKGLLQIDEDTKPTTEEPDNVPLPASGDIGGQGELRYIKDRDYIIYPVLVERDIKWYEPSVMFRSDR